MPEIRVEGTLVVQDHEIDPDHEFGLTEEAFIEYSQIFGELDDLTFAPIV